MTVREYVETNLLAELQIVKSREKGEDCLIDIYQQTIIYHYSADGYKELNAFLRTSPNGPLPEFGQLLNEVLARLPPHQDIMYRAVNLTDEQVKRYVRVGETIVEPFFVSAIKEKLSAEKHGSVLFRVVSKFGRDVSEFSKHREAEVLFANGTTFRIQKVHQQHDRRIVITMKET